MTLDDLTLLVQTADWFARLGTATAASGAVPVTVDAWQQFMVASTEAEFGLSQEDGVGETSPFAVCEWLPTANDEADPIHGRALELAARKRGQEAVFKAARLAVYRVALVSQRGLLKRPELMAGPTDTNEAAHMAGRYASRMAASEIVVDRVGFWCEIVRLFHLGHWPLGRLPDGTILVL